MFSVPISDKHRDWDVHESKKNDEHRQRDSIAQDWYLFYSKIIGDKNKISKSQYKYQINTMTISKVQPSSTDKSLIYSEIL